MGCHSYIMITSWTFNISIDWWFTVVVADDDWPLISKSEICAAFFLYTRDLVVITIRGALQFNGCIMVTYPQFLAIEMHLKNHLPIVIYIYIICINIGMYIQAVKYVIKLFFIYLVPKLAMWGFPKSRGYPNRRMVYFMEKSSIHGRCKGTPILGNHQLFTARWFMIIEGIPCRTGVLRMVYPDQLFLSEYLRVMVIY